MPLHVSVVASNCGSIPRSIVRALEALGCKVDMFIYGAPQSSWTVRRALDRIVDPGLERRAGESFNAQLCEALAVSPDVLLVVKGEVLSDVSRRRLDQSRAAIGSWAIDSLSRCPNQASIWPWAKVCLVIDGGDTKSPDSEAIWMPLGYDESLYTPSENKDIDILLVGRLGPRYTTRRAHLTYLANSDLWKRFRAAFVGNCGNRVRNFTLWNAKRTLEWIGPSLPEAELGARIARSRLCVNILQDDGIHPINPMFFAIPGAGTCQLTQDHEYLRAWLQPGVEFVTFLEGEFVERVRGLMEDPESIAEISRYGFKTAVSCHTYKQRLRSILAGLEFDVPASIGVPAKR